MQKYQSSIRMDPLLLAGVADQPVIVSNVNDGPKLFYVQHRSDPPSYSPLVSLTSQLAKEVFQKLTNPQLRQLCLAKVGSDDTGAQEFRVCRGEIKEVFPGDTCSVFLYDYGCTISAPAGYLTPMPSYANTLPRHAMPCRLAGVDRLSLVPRHVLHKAFQTYTRDHIAHLTSRILGKIGSELVEVELRVANVNKSILDILMGETAIKPYVQAKLAAVEYPMEALEPEYRDRCFTTYVQDPSVFFVLPKSKMDDLVDMMKSMEKAYANVQPTSNQTLTIGAPCAVMQSDGKWYRGRIKGGSINFLTVHLVDAGLTDRFAQEKVCALKAEFLSFPPFAVECQLHNIVPSGLWTQAEVDLFVQMTRGRELHLIVRGETKPFVYAVDLYTDEKQHVNLEFVKTANAMLAGVACGVSTESVAGAAPAVPPKSPGSASGCPILTAGQSSEPAAMTDFFGRRFGRSQQESMPGYATSLLSVANSEFVKFASDMARGDIASGVSVKSVAQQDDKLLQAAVIESQLRAEIDRLEENRAGLNELVNELQHKNTQLKAELASFSQPMAELASLKECSLCCVEFSETRYREALLPCGHSTYCCVCVAKIINDERPRAIAAAIESARRLGRPRPNPAKVPIRPKCPNCRNEFTNKKRIFID